MGRGIIRQVVLCALLLCGADQLARAGSNAGGTAYLSWDRPGTVFDLSNPPATPFPLYLHLGGASDVRSLAVAIKWTPYDSLGQCYSLVSAVPERVCGGASQVPPGGGFEGDSTYTWTITFPPTTTERNCVVYMVSAATCPSPQPADFFVVSVRVKDSNGAVDDLVVSGRATIGSGTNTDPPLTVQSVPDRTILPGQVNLIAIKGTNFTRESWAELRSPTQTVPATTVDRSSSQLLFARFDVPESIEPFVRLVVGDGRGSVDSLSYWLVATDTTMFTGRGVNTLAWPIDKIVRGGAMRKDPGTSTWRFIEGLSDSAVRAQHGEAFLQKLRETSRDESGAVDLSSRGSEISQESTGRTPQPAELQQTMACGPTITVFTEGFEQPGSIPGELWDTGLDPNWGTNYVWSDVDYLCGYVHGGFRSAHCAANGSPSLDCYQYANDMDNYLELRDYQDLSAYSRYEPSFWVRFQTEANWDYVQWWYKAGSSGWLLVNGYSGNSYGWIQKKVTVVNTFQDSSQFKIRFGFESDYNDLPGFGAYLDDIRIDGTPLPNNLVPFTPAGWYGPIVPTWRPFTTRLDTLYAGQPTRIDWAFKNEGDGAIGCPFSVGLYLDGTLIRERRLTALGAGETWMETDFTYTAPIAAGQHTLQVRADIYNEVPEQFESDNSYAEVFTWIQPPDLVVQSMTATPSSLPAGTLTQISITIRNQGATAAAGVFRTGFYQNRTSPPPAGTAPDTMLSTSILSPGAAQTFQFYRTAATQGTWQMYAFVDYSTLVPEGTGETNNVFGPVTVTWSQPPPILVSGRFVYLDSLAGSERSCRCARVVVYDYDGTSADDSLAAGYVDAAGNFGPLGVPDTETDPGVAGHPDLYVKLVLENDATCLGGPVVAVKNPVGSWWFTSDTLTDVAPGAYNLGTIKPDTTDYADRAAMHIYNTIVRGHDWIVQQGSPRVKPILSWKYPRLVSWTYAAFRI